MKVLLTGANGFIGRHVLEQLLAGGHQVRALSRRPVLGVGEEREGLEWQVIDDIGPETDWTDALRGVEVIIHLAGHAHRAEGGDDDTAHERINFHGTRRLAESAAGHVRRLIFLSSIAVHGLRESDAAIDEETPLRPASAYAESKARAEEHLASVQERGWMETLCLRVPLVVGPNAPGNLGRLQAAVARGWPLPFAGVRNQRSLLGATHLARALCGCIETPAFSRNAYVLADAEPLGTADMIRALAEGQGGAPRLWALSPALLRRTAVLLGGSTMAEQLLGSLTVNASSFRREVGDYQQQSTFEALRDSMIHG
ncbi:NAD-dependent epimerase/dehydratase family protein [Natronospira bacteriovora]|uniref:NAD-dependent epimerase/dehydratase family protein n=1 Tax=Natronospira bacteriovora TaxID=3069753 RepID=A0ABU0WAY9_9GAMM|nr:NAD-dependent epimerase/dehydratase family protein [Natronospira sp. AB-CW4]MDQ2070110.1 NAD-dependent epimerase/dehydratase family protein [Natronospira sp. AB-CW4]